MKKVLLCFMLFSCFLMNAQEIGVRFGEVSGNNVALDGAFDFEGSRIHANVSFGDNIGLDVLWDFIYKPIESSNFHWYVGVGPSAILGDNFFLGASGEVGVEYVFKDAPIVIGLDYRPTLWIVEDTDFEVGGFGLNIRYRF